MALMECPECSKSISDTVDSCPSCGYQFKKGSAGGSFTRKAVHIVAIFLGAFGTIVGFTVGNSAFGAVGVVAVVIGAIKLNPLRK